jgi:hypothetical protein
MAKAEPIVDRKYTNLSRLFDAKEQAKKDRAHLSPTEKYRMVQRLNEINKSLKSAKIIKRQGVKRG